MPNWEAVAVRLLEVPPLPKKTFLFTNEDHVELQALAKALNLTQTDAIRWAIRNLNRRIERGDPIFVPGPPKGTSGPAAASSPPLRVVENQGKRRATPTARRQSNTNRGKK